MISYTTEKCLVYIYDPVLDNFEQAEKEALLKHGINGARITTIGVTRQTDFIKNENSKIQRR